MFVRPTNPVSHRLARLAFITAGVAALVVASAGPLHRYVGLDVEADFAVFRYGFHLALPPGGPGLGPHRADAARRSPARLRGGAARHRDRRGRRLYAARLVPARPAIARD